MPRPLKRTHKHDIDLCAKRLERFGSDGDLRLAERRERAVGIGARAGERIAVAEEIEGQDGGWKEY